MVLRYQVYEVELGSLDVGTRLGLVLIEFHRVVALVENFSDGAAGVVN
jgi:hypothetical protein